jgi:hypothetical protein
VARNAEAVQLLLERYPERREQADQFEQQVGRARRWRVFAAAGPASLPAAI